MKKEVLIVIIIILIIIGVATYFILKGGEGSTTVPGGDYGINDEGVDYAAGTDVGENIAGGTQANIFEGVETNPFDENE